MAKIVRLGDKLTVLCSGGGSHPHGVREATVTAILPNKISTLTTIDGKPIAYVGAKVQATCYDTGVIFAPGANFVADDSQTPADTDCGIGVGTPWDGNNGDRLVALIAWNYSYGHVEDIK